MRTEEYNKECPECKSQFVASRTDQHFCNDKCRYDYHNRHAKANRKITGAIVQRLMRNRNILHRFFAGYKKFLVTRDELKKFGFNFSYHTHSVIGKDKVKYDFIFDYGIALVGQDNFKVTDNGNV